MKNPAINNVKLGSFVLAGMVFLVLLLYMIGKNRSLFGVTYVLKVQVENAQGLVTGNNVRFAGIEAGTVKTIEIVADTVIEITMVINRKMLAIIRKNALVSIGTEGLVGNKVVNIVPARTPAPLAVNGDLLVAKKGMDTDRMLQTLEKTNHDVAEVAVGLKAIVQRFNNHGAIWGLLEDTTLAKNISQVVVNVKTASRHTGAAASNLEGIVTDIKTGKGAFGAILQDTSLSYNLHEAIVSFRQAGKKTDSLTAELMHVVEGLQNDIDEGKGVVNALLKDSVLANSIDSSVNNIRAGTAKFDENMDALQHHFLFRGYFKKQEKKRAKNK